MFWLVISLAWLLVGYASTYGLIKESVREAPDLKWNPYVIGASIIVIVGWPIFWFRVLLAVMRN